MAPSSIVLALSAFAWLVTPAQARAADACAGRKLGSVARSASCRMAWYEAPVDPRVGSAWIEHPIIDPAGTF